MRDQKASSKAAWWHAKGKRLTEMACRAEATYPRRALELHSEAAEAFRKALHLAELASDSGVGA